MEFLMVNRFQNFDISDDNHGAENKKR